MSWVEIIIINMLSLQEQHDEGQHFNIDKEILEIENQYSSKRKIDYIDPLRESVNKAPEAVSENTGDGEEGTQRSCFDAFKMKFRNICWIPFTETMPIFFTVTENMNCLQLTQLWSAVVLVHTTSVSMLFLDIGGYNPLLVFLLMEASFIAHFGMVMRCRVFLVSFQSRSGI